MSDLERRNGILSETRVSAQPSMSPGRIHGRAITYNSLSEDLGGFREVFKPGSVRLADDLLILFNHDSGTVVGRTTAGTARANDDGRGVVFEAEPPNTQWAQDLAISMKRGDIRQCSFAFRTISDEFYWDNTLETVIREVTGAEVVELSIVAMPAYPATAAQVG